MQIAIPPSAHHHSSHQCPITSPGGLLCLVFLFGCHMSCCETWLHSIASVVMDYAYTLLDSRVERWNVPLTRHSFAYIAYAHPFICTVIQMRTSASDSNISLHYATAQQCNQRARESASDAENGRSQKGTHRGAHSYRY